MSAITRLNECRWIGELDCLGTAIETIGIDEPLLIGIGSVFSKALRSSRDCGPSANFKMDELRDNFESARRLA
jgi:hypothetical protein